MSYTETSPRKTGLLNAPTVYNPEMNNSSPVCHMKKVEYYTKVILLIVEVFLMNYDFIAQ